METPKVVNLTTCKPPEVGDQVIVHIEPLAHNIQATWLGTVGNGHDLATAMRLMHDLGRRRDAEKRLCAKVQLDEGGSNEQVPDLRSRHDQN